jgi:hypothetical protein
MRRQTIKEIERQIGEKRRQIDWTAAQLERADPLGLTPLPIVLESRRVALCPLFRELNRLTARLPDEPRAEAVTLEALLCQLDHEAERRKRR